MRPAVVTDLVDGVAHGKQFASFSALETPFLLQQSDDQRASVVSIALVSVDYSHTVLWVSPERVWSAHQVHVSISNIQYIH